ncbi:MAG: Holliday junction branch migration protein RuvA [Suilimivivens sp.]
MIAFIKGVIEDIAGDNVIIDTGGIGYNLKISEGTAAALPGIGREVKLYTYTCVREDAFLLYGFLTRDDLEIFKKLITVNGIGPKGGLAILSVMSADDLRFAIMSGDAKAIAKAPGIGAKTASRVILDLRDKISIEDTLIKREMNEHSGNDARALDNAARNEAVEALIALGYNPSDALKAVKKAAPAEDADVETILKLALKNMY